MNDLCEYPKLREFFQRYRAWSENNMSIEAWAKKIGVSKYSLTSWCCGRRLIEPESIEIVFRDDEFWKKEAYRVRREYKYGDELLGISSENAYSELPYAVLTKTDRRFLSVAVPNGNTFSKFVEVANDMDLDAWHARYSDMETKLALSMIGNETYEMEEDCFCDCNDEVRHRTRWLSENMKIGDSYWMNFVLFKTNDNKMTPYLHTVDGGQSLRLMPSEDFVPFLKKYLWAKGSDAFIKNIKGLFDGYGLQMEQEVRSYTGNWFFSITLNSLYELCRFAAGGKVAVAEWYSNREEPEYVDLIYDNSPRGFGNWAYLEHDKHREHLMPQGYREIIDGLVYSSIIRTGEERKYSAGKNSLRGAIKEAVYGRTDGQEQVVYQKIISLSEDGRKYLSWYEKYVKDMDNKPYWRKE